MKLSESVVVITGGASGLGAAVADRVIADGGRVIVADLNADAGERRMASWGDRARFFALDVADASQMEQLIEHAQTQFGAVNGLVCCAGIAPGEKVVGKNGAHRLDTFRRAIEVNLIGTFNAIRCAAAAMCEQTPTASGERGVIVTTASIAAFDGQIGQAAYAASKGGVVGMTLPIARELATHGIRIMTIAPGIFSTPMLENLPENVQESLGKMVPFPSRLGQPSEYARLVRDIFENEMLNGEVIRLDGALRMAAR